MMEELPLFIAQSTKGGMWKQFSSSFVAQGFYVLPVAKEGQEIVESMHVWKSQGRSFKGKDHDLQEQIAGQVNGDSGTEVLSKQAQKTSVMNDTVQLLLSWLRTVPCGLSSPFHRFFYKYVLKVCSVITNKGQHVSQTLPNVSRSGVHAKMSKLTWNQD